MEAFVVPVRKHRDLPKNLFWQAMHNSLAGLLHLSQSGAH